MAPPVVALFIGGAGSRMGGAPKGLLVAPDTGETLVVRSTRLVRAVMPSTEVVLVGNRPEYKHLSLRRLDDAVHGIGPLGGLLALLSYALQCDSQYAIAIAADLPYVTEKLLERLLTHEPEASAVAPLIEGRWQPLFARYTAPATLPVAQEQLHAGNHSLQPLLSKLEAHPLPLAQDEVEKLADWDTPSDLAPH